MLLSEPYSNPIKDNFLLKNLRFDSLNVQFVGNWPFAEIHNAIIDSSRDLLYCSSGGGVCVIDISTVSNPILLSEKIHTRGVVKDFFYDDINYILGIAASGGGIELWDMSDSINPQKYSTFFTKDEALGIYKTSSYCYVADMDSGLRIIDVSNLSNPIEIGYCDTPGYA